MEQGPRSETAAGCSRPLAAELWAVAQAVAAELGLAARIVDGPNTSEVRVDSDERRTYVVDWVSNVGTTIERSAPRVESWQGPAASLWLRRVELAAALIEEGWPASLAIWDADKTLRETAPAGVYRQLAEGREFP